MRSVLLVDPDLDALGELASALRARGLTVLVADSLEGAADRARRQPPDAVIVTEALAPALTDSPLAGPEVPTLVLGTGPDTLAPFDVDGIARRVFAQGARQAQVAVDRGDFRGDLGQVSLPDLLQLLSMNRRTGALTLSTPTGAGEVRLIEGEIADAAYRRLDGEKALYRLLAEGEGSFAFSTSAPSPLRRVQVATHLVLMEGLRQVDEVRRLHQLLDLGSDALIAAQSLTEDAPDVPRRIVELLSAPRTVGELLDDLPTPDLEVLEQLAALLESGHVRRVPQGALRVELGDPDELSVLAAQVKRKTRAGFSAAPRLCILATPQRLALILHAVRRVGDAVAPAESVPAAPVPHVLATLRLGEGVDLDVVGIPNLDAFAPLWSLSLPGAVAAVHVDGERHLAESLCELAAVPLVSAGALIGELDDADPAQVAALLRAALDAASA